MFVLGGLFFGCLNIVMERCWCMLWDVNERDWTETEVWCGGWMRFWITQSPQLRGDGMICISIRDDVIGPLLSSAQT